MLAMNDIYWRQRDVVLPNAPCLFLDRDGVLVEEVNYLGRRQDVRMIDGVARVLAQARGRGYAVGVVSNQAGIGRAYYDWIGFEEVQHEVVRRLEGQPFDFVAACGAHPQAVIPALRVDDHPWRKPNPGMIQRAAQALTLDLASSIMVGDQLTDLRAGATAGVGILAHVLTGHGVRDRPMVMAAFTGDPRVVFIDSLARLPDALGWTRDPRLPTD